MGDQLPATLTSRLASSATGYGAVIDGVLNVRTVSETRNATALNALFITGIMVHNPCRDLDCDCLVKLLAKLRPKVKIVAVSVEARDG